MTVTINGTSGITTPGVNSTASNTLGDAAGDTLNVGNGVIVTDSSGNVGIGTSSPTSKLDVSGSIRASTSYILTGIGTIAGSTANLTLNGAGNTGVVSVLTDGLERMRIDSSGNLLVGTTSQYSSGVVNVAYNSSSNVGLVFRNSSTTLSNACVIFQNSSGSTAGYISQNGTTTVQYITSSDYRLKENIQPMTGALDKVLQLNPVTYTWKVDGSDGQGFIAHELQAVVPDCVGGEKDAVDADGNPVYQGIDTSFLVATLTKAIQELSAKNDALEARLTAAEEQILALGVK